MARRLIPELTNAIARFSDSFRFCAENVSFELNTVFLNWTIATDVPKSTIPANKKSRAVSTISISPKVSNGSIMLRIRNAPNAFMNSRIIEILIDRRST